MKNLNPEGFYKMKLNNIYVGVTFDCIHCGLLNEKYKPVKSTYCDYCGKLNKFIDLTEK